ncbi:MAG: hypothetical protein AAGI11_16595 [Pseudomonadota bacterium]
MTATLVLAVFGVSPTMANSIQDTHTFRLGAYVQDVDVNAALTREPFDEVEINFDRVLGVEDSADTFFAGYTWRFTERWNLGVYLSTMSADGSRQASRDFTWDGEEYEAGSRVSTEFDLDTYLVTANYSFARNEHYEWGLGFGLHAFDIETTLEVAVQLDEFFENVRRSNSTVLAPLPNLRAYGTWAIAPKWEVSVDFGWLSVTYDDYDGDYLFFNAQTEYRITDRFGLGLSYQASQIDVTVDKSRGEDAFDIDLFGPSLYLTYGF